MKKTSALLSTISLILLIFSAHSPAVGATAGPAPVDSMQAYEMVMKNPSDAFIIDVRTMAEYEFVGHPDLPNGVANIPLRFYPSWEVNKDFVKKVEERYKKSDTLLTICRSGKRAEAAARLLKEAGFDRVYYITDSFEGRADARGHRTIDGWKVNGLPYTYELHDDLIYK